MDISKIGLVLFKSIPTILFLSIAFIAIYFVLSVPVIHKELPTGEEQVESPMSTTLPGLKLRYSAWVEYPQYNIGMGAIAIVGFVGAALTGYTLIKDQEEYEAETA